MVEGEIEFGIGSILLGIVSRNDKYYFSNFNCQIAICCIELIVTQRNLLIDN